MSLYRCILLCACVTWDSLTYSSSIIQQVIFVVSVPNVWGTIDKLVSQGLQPWASRALCDSVREVNGCEFHLHITFCLWVYPSSLSMWNCDCVKYAAGMRKYMGEVHQNGGKFPCCILVHKIHATHTWRQVWSAHSRQCFGPGKVLMD